MTALPRRILHVDCDMFYVQVAQLLDPEGAGRKTHLIVGGTPGGRGVVTSASYPVRGFGVRSGMPTGQALRLCPQATVVPVPRGACLERSHRVRDALTDVAPVVQAASIDEFYLDLSGTERLPGYADLDALAHSLREAVHARSEISVSVGGGTTRIVAKLATSLAKPGGVHVVAPGSEGEFMRRFDLAAIPGVGPTLAAALARRGLATVAEALEVEEVWLQRWFGDARGAWLHRRIRGEDGSTVDPDEPRKSISSERTFLSDLDADDLLEEHLFKLAIAVGGSLRKAGLRARTVTVKLRDADFTTRTAARTLPEPVESDGALYRVGRELLESLRRKRRRPARLLGVGVSGLAPAVETRQLEFFGTRGRVEGERERRLGQAVDRLRARFGEAAVLPGRITSSRPRDDDLDGRTR
ncbi:MAG: DNA polymerase IV [Gemmatimonadetes bacterium]|nr:DNA polymerase IV [Gemmatimonadota bacterium]